MKVLQEQLFCAKKGRDSRLSVRSEMPRLARVSKAKNGGQRCPPHAFPDVGRIIHMSSTGNAKSCQLSVTK